MTQYHLKVNRTQLEVGWSAKLIAQFEPVANCGQERFWVREVEAFYSCGRIPTSIML